MKNNKTINNQLSKYNKNLLKELKKFKKEIKELGLYHESKYELKSPYDWMNSQNLKN